MARWVKPSWSVCLLSGCKPSLNPSWGLGLCNPKARNVSSKRFCQPRKWQIVRAKVVIRGPAAWLRLVGTCAERWPRTPMASRVGLSGQRRYAWKYPCGTELAVPRDTPMISFKTRTSALGTVQRL